MYFTNVHTLAELKAEYRRLALMYHPDRGGSVDIMQQINAEHDRLFEVLKAQQNERAAADTTGRTKATTETAAEFRDIIEALIRIGDDLVVELCGVWVWITGATYKYKDDLKRLGCKYSGNKKAWYWRHPEDADWRPHRSASMEQIRSKYGSTVFEAETQEAIPA